jgi:hypothetical protein
LTKKPLLQQQLPAKLDRGTVVTKLTAKLPTEL